MFFVHFGGAGNVEKREMLMRNIYIMVFVLFFSCFAPSLAYANVGGDVKCGFVNEAAEHLRVKGDRVQVLKSKGKVLKVYNITGVCVMQYRVDSNDAIFRLDLPKGIYILALGRETRKIVLR